MELTRRSAATLNDDYYSDFKQIEEKHKVRITGLVVQKIVPEAIKKAFDLIRAVDDWLIKNP